MSAWSEAYHAMPREDQEFCHNWSLRASFYCTPFLSDDPYQINPGFFMPGHGWTGATSADVAHSNLNVNFFMNGTCRNVPMILFPAGYGFNLDDEPARSPFGYYPWYPQFEWIPTLSLVYPRPRFKARRTYWTGVPRRRRNLPRV
jgi:hypothetical protein